MTYADVKAARIKCGMTQAAMSKHFGIPIRTISDWERGLREPPEWTCKLLVDALNRLRED